MCVFLSDVQQIAIKRCSSELAHEYVYTNIYGVYAAACFLFLCFRPNFSYLIFNTIIHRQKINSKTPFFSFQFQVRFTNWIVIESNVNCEKKRNEIQALCTVINFVPFKSSKREVCVNGRKWMKEILQNVCVHWQQILQLKEKRILSNIIRCL